jgi:hypothetical protein
MPRVFTAPRARAASTLGLLFALVGCAGAPDTAPGTTLAPTAPAAVLPTATVMPTPIATVMPTPTATPLPSIEVGQPVVGGSQTVGPGDEIPISIPVDGPAGVKIDYVWIIPEGKGAIVTGDGTPAITYKAPTEPGTYQIRVKVTATGRDIERSVPIKVEAPPTPPPSTVTLTALGEIEFTSPESLQKHLVVPCENVAEGTYSSGIEQPIWPVVYVARKYYPQDQSGGSAPKANGKWVGTVRFGDCDEPPPANRGVVFQLIIVAADQQCNQAFDDYLAEARAGNSGFSGMPSLPAGCREYVRITVVRQ